jgi:hypothetical protein
LSTNDLSLSLSLSLSRLGLIFLGQMEKETKACMMHGLQVAWHHWHASQSITAN